MVGVVFDCVTNTALALDAGGGSVLAIAKFLWLDITFTLAGISTFLIDVACIGAGGMLGTGAEDIDEMVCMVGATTHVTVSTGLALITSAAPAFDTGTYWPSLLCCTTVNSPVTGSIKVNGSDVSVPCFNTVFFTASAGILGAGALGSTTVLASAVY